MHKEHILLQYIDYWGGASPLWSEACPESCRNAKELIGVKPTIPTS